MTAASRQTRRLCKSRMMHRRKVATGLFAVAILVSLAASQCSSSEDSLDESVSSATIAGTTVDAATTTRAEATTKTKVDATTTTEVGSSTTSSPETSPPVADTGDPEAAEAEEQVEVPEEPNIKISTTTMPGSSETGSEESDSSDTPSSQTSGISLSSFAGCDALLDYMRGEALERVGPYGFASDLTPISFIDRSEGIVADDLPEAEGVPAPPSLDMGTGPPEPPPCRFWPLRRSYFWSDSRGRFLGHECAS